MLMPILLSSAVVTFSSGTSEVVIASDAPQTVVFAAQEATNFLSQALGAGVPLRTARTPGRTALVLGSNDWTRAAGIRTEALAEEAFRIVTGDGAVYIAGRDDPKANLVDYVEKGHTHLLIHRHATAFGVYEFLERFAGVRFYFPGELGTIVPRRTEIAVPATDETCAPAMQVRTTNLSFDGDGKVWYEPSDDNRTRLRGKAKEYLRLRFQTGEVPCCHGQSFAMIRERFAETHPEYFALLKTWDRKEPYRDVEATSKSHHPGQLCQSSAVWDEFYEDAKAYLTGQDAAVRGVPSPWQKGRFAWNRNLRSRRYVDVMPQDGFQPCQCERCLAAYDRTEPYGMYATDLLWRQTARLAHRPGRLRRVRRERDGQVDLQLPQHLRLPEDAVESEAGH